MRSRRAERPKKSFEPHRKLLKPHSEESTDSAFRNQMILTSAQSEQDQHHSESTIFRLTFSIVNAEVDSQVCKFEHLIDPQSVRRQGFWRRLRALPQSSSLQILAPAKVNFMKMVKMKATAAQA